MKRTAWIIERIPNQEEPEKWPPHPLYIGIDMDKKNRSFYLSSNPDEAIQFSRERDCNQAIGFLHYWGFTDATSLEAREHFFT